METLQICPPSLRSQSVCLTDRSHIFSMLVLRDLSESDLYQEIGTLTSEQTVFCSGKSETAKGYEGEIRLNPPEQYPISETLFLFDLRKQHKLCAVA